MIHKYSPTNFHEMNLDWILKRIEELEAKEDGCQCDEEALKKEIEKLKAQIQSLQNVDEYLQKEIDDLRIPIMQKKDFAQIWNGIDFNMKAKTFGKEPL